MNGLDIITLFASTEEVVYWRFLCQYTISAVPIVSLEERPFLLLGGV